MIIVCNKCNTKFKVPDDKVRPGGIKVRCSKCKTVFRALPEHEKPQENKPPPIAPSDDINLDFQMDGLTQPTGLESKSSPETAPPPKNDIRGKSAEDLFDFDAINQKPEPPPKSPPQPSPKPSIDKPATIPEKKDPAPDFDIPVATQAPPPSAGEVLDDKLDELLEGNSPPQPEPNPSLASANDVLSNVPLTMPSDIDLSELGKDTIDTLPSEITEDGIELVGKLDQAEPPTRTSPTPSLFDEEVPEATPPNPTPLTPPSPIQPSFPTAPAKMKPSMGGVPDMGIAPAHYASKESNFGKYLLWIFLLSFLLVGFATFVVFNIHGKISLGQYNLKTFQTFISKYKPQKTTPDSGQSEDENAPQNGPRVLITNSSTTFIRNIENDLILVISGKAKNTYSNPLSFIKIKALIFGTNGIKVAEKEVWAGNAFSRDEIYKFRSQESIDSQYVNAGNSLSNMNIQPDAFVPFQFIVINPSEEWSEFKVIVSGSQESAE